MTTVEQPNLAGVIGNALLAGGGTPARSSIAVELENLAAPGNATS
jgi:hypothetical protein